MTIPTFLALFIYIIYIIVKCITQNIAVQAFQAIILFFSEIQVMLFGIIGEYLGRIFNETKNRPLYFIKEYNDIREENKKR